MSEPFSAKFGPHPWDWKRAGIRFIVRRAKKSPGTGTFEAAIAAQCMAKATYFSSQSSDAAPSQATFPDRPDSGFQENGSERQLRRHQVVSTGDGVAWGIMTGLGETYLPAFALAMGIGEVTSGLVASIPMALGGWLQLITPWGVKRTGSYRSWVVTCVVLQSLSFLPLIASAFQGAASALLVFAAATGYWAAGQASSPAWNIWIGKLIPREIRSQFFASRTRWAQFATCFGFVLGGSVLQLAKAQDWLAGAFALIFVASFVVRIISAYMLCLHADSRPHEDSTDDSSAAASDQPGAASEQPGPNLNLIGYLVVVQAFAQLSGPYFTPYILKRLDYSYLQFVALIGSSYVAKAVSLPYWGKVAHQQGAWRLLRIGGIGIIPLAAVWIPTNNFWLLAVNQVAAGVFWGAYELAFFLLFFESIPEKKRTAWLTWYNAANSTAWAVGSITGGVLLRQYGAVSWAYHLLFLLSSLGRAGAFICFFPRTAENRVGPRRSASLLPASSSGIALPREEADSSQNSESLAA